MQTSMHMVFTNDRIFHFTVTIMVFICFETNTNQKIGHTNDIVVFEFSFMDDLAVYMRFVGRAQILNDPHTIFGGIKNSVLPGNGFIRKKDLAAHLPADINRAPIKLQFVNTALAETYEQTHRKSSNKHNSYWHYCNKILVYCQKTEK